MLVLLEQSCRVKECNFDQNKLNELGQEALKYALSNDCFTFQSFSSDSTINIISVCSDLKNFDTDSSLKYLDDQIRNRDNKILEKFNTIKIENWSGKQVYMSPWKDIILGIDFSEILVKKIHNSSHSIGIRSYIFSKPELIKSDNVYTVVFKISRYFESIIENVDLFLETDMSFNLIKISCHKPVLKEIPHYLKDFPQDRPDSVENIDFYFNKNNVLLALMDSFLYQFNQKSIFSFEKYKKVKNISFISLSPYFCTNDNQEYYETPIEIQRMSDNSIKLISSDTCETRRLSKSGNVYWKMNFNGDKVFWDSIVIQNNNNPGLKRLIHSTEGKFRYHLLTVDQEVVLLAKNITSLIDDPLNKKNFFKIKIYYKGELIKTSFGNKFPYTLNSIYYKFLE